MRQIQALCEVALKLSFLLFIAFILSGCVVYPARHVSEPRYIVSVVGGNLSSIEISSSLDAKDGACEGGKPLVSGGGNKYFSEEEYGWVKAAFFVPIDSYKPIKICAVSEDGQKYYWEENIGVFGNEYPKVWKFSCKISSGNFECEKIT